MIHGKTIDQWKVGDTAEFAKTVTESEIYLFAGVTGDLNPAHVNETRVDALFSLNRFLKENVLAREKEEIENTVT